MIVNLADVHYDTSPEEIQKMIEDELTESELEVFRAMDTEGKTVLDTEDTSGVPETEQLFDEYISDLKETIDLMD
jgi:signal recognition particle receptor subunit beta